MDRAPQATDGPDHAAARIDTLEDVDRPGAPSHVVPDRVPSNDDQRAWAIRDMPMGDRRAALAAAKRARKSVAVWLGEAIRAYIEQERDDGGARSGEIIELGQALVTGELSTPTPPLTIAEIGEAVRIAQTVAALRDKPLAVNGRFLVRVERALRERVHRS